MEAAKKIMAKESGYNVEPLDLIQPSKVWSTYLAKKDLGWTHEEAINSLPRRVFLADDSLITTVDVIGKLPPQESLRIIVSNEKRVVYSAIITGELDSGNGEASSTSSSEWNETQVNKETEGGMGVQDAAAGKSLETRSEDAEEEYDTEQLNVHADEMQIFD
jgi:hypothetical protein